MKNLTITLDDEIANWVRIYAAQHDMSVSRLVGEVLTRRMRAVSEYDRAKCAWLARSPSQLSGPRKAYPCRDELHDRDRRR